MDPYLEQSCRRVMVLPVDTKDNIPSVRSAKHHSLRTLCPIRARPPTWSMSWHACGSVFLRMYFHSAAHEMVAFVYEWTPLWSHPCGYPRHPWSCSAITPVWGSSSSVKVFRPLFAALFPKKILFGDSTVGTPGRQPTMPGRFFVVPWWTFHNVLSEVPPTGTRSTGYSDIQNPVVRIVPNSDHTSFSVKVLRPVRNKSLSPALQVTTSHIWWDVSATSPILVYQIVILSTTSVLTSFPHSSWFLHLGGLFLVFLDIFTLSILESEARLKSGSWYIYICLCLLSLQYLVAVSHVCWDGCQLILDVHQSLCFFATTITFFTVG